MVWHWDVSVIGGVELRPFLGLASVACLGLMGAAPTDETMGSGEETEVYVLVASGDFGRRASAKQRALLTAVGMLDGDVDDFRAWHWLNRWVGYGVWIQFSLSA